MEYDFSREQQTEMWIITYVLENGLCTTIQRLLTLQQQVSAIGVFRDDAAG